MTSSDFSRILVYECPVARSFDNRVHMFKQANQGARADVILARIEMHKPHMRGASDISHFFPSRVVDACAVHSKRLLEPFPLLPFHSKLL